MDIEEKAGREGYGPLIPCNFVSSTREQKELCVNFYRTKEGILKRGQLIDSGPCSAHFEVYYPNDNATNTWIVMICHNPHLHSDPQATQTPKPIKDIFMTLLDTLEWRLADTAPRKIILDSAFMIGLRKALNWNGLQDPSLSDLHPSLGNVDHVACLINKLRLDRFPNGTGFEGILAMVEENSLLPPGQVYAMSELFLRTTQPSIDTSSKRIHRWQEFEIEAWFPEYSRSVVIARAFTTSQSAKAHKFLFQQIFAIVEADTGQQVQFRHIHGTGWDTIIADEHRGQALDWLKDKRSAENSILAAIYRPLSKLPVEVWKASPNTTNGNEQSH
ncbi:hypothetical protein M422DRAFT_271724 [Sphaerobolus stellatus SS14]|uniref:Uncharacterized protein n=1 Tax=Sphaerobolus stellatus (strain SS14) TaxID=990650 RepID=A0A0C9UP66_SPHS4|nr:hypothetical protein M422DRAFT_271724 [Sphaerobolus stellatus SS14]